ncbi:PAS-domain containing protein [Azospirillum sp. ST 5-10]|uniref:sensor histidine kinase n=1 Tax=unclassified Azospirillum TaxID=2630922 RepID=UPI003F4A382D
MTLPADHDRPPATDTLLAALELSGESFAVFDAADRLVYANARTREFFPEIADRLDAGRGFEELLRLFADRSAATPPPGPAREAWVLRRLARHRAPGAPLTVRTADGRWLQASERRLPDGGTVCVHTDVTALKRSERRLRAATARTARQEAEQTARGRIAFLGQVGDALRTPLHAMLGVTRILVGETLGPLGHRRYREYAQDIQDSGAHLLELIDDLLALTRVETGRLRLAEEPVDTSAAIATAVQAQRDAAEARGVRLETDTAGDLPLLLGDGTAVRQMVGHLLNRAVEHTPAGGRVAVSAARSPDGGVCIMVADTGGLQAGADQDSGPGLVLVRRLAELHGGRLELDRDPGAGTTAVLLFPPLSSLPRVFPPPPAAFGR